MSKEHHEYSLAEKQSYIAQARLFRRVEPAIIAGLAAAARTRTLVPNEILISPSVANSHVYLAVMGPLSVRLSGTDEPEVASISPGQCCGEISVIDEQSPSAYVVAGDHCLVLAIERDDIWHAINSSAVLPRNLLYVMSNRIRNYRDMVVEQTESAVRDSLTGVFNRRWLDNELLQRWTQAAKDRLLISLLMIDVDHFKRFNDQHGHVAGDEALRAIASRLQSATRQQDGVARYGGEEFCVLLANVTHESALHTAERIRSSIANSPLRIDGAELSVTASIGVATLKPDLRLGAEGGIQDWVVAADQALYKAKAAGRNLVIAAPNKR